MSGGGTTDGMPRPERRTILLIGGRPRSGTTLLASLIQSRLNIPVAPETHYFDIVLTEGMANLPPELTQDRRVMAAYDGLPPVPPADPVATFRLLLDRLVPCPAPVIGEKTPDHMGKFPGILKADPTFKAVIIVRNCADVCDSLARMPWNRNSFQENLWLWVLFYRDGIRMRRNFPGRVAVVRYERLCTAPERELARLAVDLKLKANPHPVPDLANYDATREPWKQGADGPVRRRRTLLFRRDRRIGLGQIAKAHWTDVSTRLRCWLRPPR